MLHSNRVKSSGHLRSCEVSEVKAEAEAVARGSRERGLNAWCGGFRACIGRKSRSGEGFGFIGGKGRCWG